MLNDEEKEFIAFWEANRLKQQKFVKYIQYGLPLGVAVGIGIFVNLFSGWNKQATTIINSDPSLILVLLVALLLIIAFIAIFTVRHRWDLNEQHYLELKAKKTDE